MNCEVTSENTFIKRVYYQTDRELPRTFIELTKNFTTYILCNANLSSEVKTLSLDVQRSILHT